MTTEASPDLNVQSDAGAPTDPDASSGTAAPPQTPARRASGCLLEIVETIIATVVLFFLIQTFVAQPFQVQQTSMETTFHEGDYLIVDRLSHLWAPYTRGQVIVFQPPASFPDSGKPLIKRIIGVAGDTIELRDGAVYVNGTKLVEPYVHRDQAGNQDQTTTLTGTTNWLVPAGQVFVMGDHREFSTDSRVFGPIDVSSVIGRGFVRYWPFDRFGLINGATYDNLAAP
jgi:signal peptidase I